MKQLNDLPSKPRRGSWKKWVWRSVATLGIAGGIATGLFSPSKLDEKWVQPTFKAVRASMYAFHPTGKEKEIDDRVNSTIIVGPSAFQKMGGAVGTGEFLGLKVTTMDDEHLSPVYVASQMISHHDDLTPNNLFFGDAFARYLSQMKPFYLAERISKEGRLFERAKGKSDWTFLKKTRTSDGWNVKVKSNLDGSIGSLVRNKAECAFSELPYSPLGHSPPEFSRFLKANNSNKLLEYLQEYYGSTSSSERRKIAVSLGDWCANLETLLVKPGLGSTILRLVSKGKSLQDAEWEAISGSSETREKKFAELLGQAFIGFEAIEKQKKPR